MITKMPDMTTPGRLDKQELAADAPPEFPWRLSIYMPLEESWTEIKDGDIRLRDLRKQAMNEMARQGLGSAEIKVLLEPVDRILDGSEAFVFHGKGLAILSGKDFSSTVHLSEAPPSLVEIDAHFNLEPLLPTISGKDRFYLLCLSLNAIHLFDGDGFSLRRIPLGIETSLRQTLRAERTDFHHRHGTLQSDGTQMKKEALSIFRRIDKAVCDRLPHKERPLILAGVGYLLPIYREANSFPGLSDAEIPGNADLPSESLREKASALLREAARAEAAKALATYRENLATARTASGFTDVVPLAARKGLTHLFIRKGFRQWGTFNPADGKTKLMEAWRPGAQDLINLACVRTLASGGAVHALDAGEMPRGSGIAGLCRD